MARMTVGEALVRFLAAQRTDAFGTECALFGGVFAIFGHGNVAGLGEALSRHRDVLPTFRAHNEQAMAHAAIAFAKANRRRRMLACATSIGPGATNLVTACATAHVNRLPLLLLPGDVFATRAPDPVLQQIERFDEPNVTANDCLRPVSRFWDRIVRPEQLMPSLREAIRVLTDPADCGPVTVALPQDVQAEAYDYAEDLFVPRVHRTRRPRPDREDVARAGSLIARAKAPLVIAGGGVLYSGASGALACFVERHHLPVAETQAGKGALPWRHPRNAGAIGVTGSSAANELARDADVVLAIGTRLSDFTTASRTLFSNPSVTFIGLNVAPFDAHKHGSFALVADAAEGILALGEALTDFRAPDEWSSRTSALIESWNRTIDRVTSPRGIAPPSDAEVVGAVNRGCGENGVVVGAAGGLPGDLHKLWRASGPGGYHVEYGYSCMGYEIAGGLGVKMAEPHREVYVLVGDGSYLMLNSEIATSVTLGHKLIIVLLDNHGFGCIHRLQKSCGGDPFNNLLDRSGIHASPEIDFVAHASSLGAHAEKVTTIDELEAALARARARSKTSVVVIETDPEAQAGEGGAWWDVAVSAESPLEEVRGKRRAYLDMKRKQRT